MTEILAVFRSRAQAMDCGARFKAGGIAAVLVNTPKEAGVGCGLSLKVPRNMLARAKMLVRRGNYSAFYGFFAVKNNYGKTFLQRL